MIVVVHKKYCKITKGSIIWNCNLLHLTFIEIPLVTKSNHQFVTTYIK